MLSNSDISQFDAEDIIENNNGVVNSKFTQDPKVIEYALHYICSFDKQTGKHSIDQSKVVKSIALAMLYVKGDFFLKEYVQALKCAFDIALDSEYLPSAEFDSSQNLFELYNGYNLAFLKGYAVIIPQQELKMINKPDDVIKILHPYYSKEFDGCFGSVERRLEQLFEIKDKWTS